MEDNEYDTVFDGQEPELGMSVYNPTELSYFLSFNIDKEISEADICSTIGDLKIRNIYLDEKIKCPDYEQDQRVDIYSSRVRPEDLEDCD